MKQKIVIKVPMNGKKSRSKVLKIAVGVHGVESVAITGQDKNQIEVIGEGVDSVELTELLRKNLSYSEVGFGSYLRKNEHYAELVSVTPLEEKKDKGGGSKVNIEPCHLPLYHYGYPCGGFVDPYYRGW